MWTGLKRRRGRVGDWKGRDRKRKGRRREGRDSPSWGFWIR